MTFAAAPLHFSPMQALIPDAMADDHGARVVALWQTAGWAMWPLALCAFLAAAVVLWKLSDLSVRGARTMRLLDRVDDLVERRMIAEALAAARESDTPGGHVLAAGLARRAGGAARVARSIGNAGVMEAASLGRGLVLLAAVVAVTPLIGFFGAVLSLLAATHATDPDGSALGGALVPAAAGLAIAIPGAIVHQYMTGRVERIMKRIGESGQRAVDAIRDSEAGAGPAA